MAAKYSYRSQDVVFFVSPRTSTDEDAIMSALKRIIVVGTTASGKTTMASRLSQRLDLRHVELDALHWEANWTKAATDVLRERVLAALPDDGWVVDGNYSAVRDILWPRADTVVWLDYPLPLILVRLTRRTFVRVASRIELWNGNRERLFAQFFTRDSLYLWVLQTHRLRRRQYTQLVAEPVYAHLTVIRLRSPHAAARWLATLANR